MRLGVFRLIKLFFASIFLQCSWSFHSMQSMGFLFNVILGLSKEKKDLLLQNSRVFFNTHPYMVGYIIGAVLRAYEKNEDPEEIKNHIMVGQSVFASAGDLLFWQTIRPVLLLVATIIGLKYGIAGPLIFVIIYNIIHVYFRFDGFVCGYEQGWDVVYIIKSRKVVFMQRLFESLGAFFAGLLPIVLQKNFNLFFLLPLVGIFLILLWKKVAPILILTFVFILIIINLILI
ncbi:MAG: PTS system mannose/fructose/sorbose family transporter subunit IID [bacterium]